MCDLISQKQEEIVAEKVDEEEIIESSNDNMKLETLYGEAYDLYSQGRLF